MLVLWLTADGQVSHYYVIFFVFYITVISFAVIRVISAVSWDANYGKSRLQPWCHEQFVQLVCMVWNTNWFYQIRYFLQWVLWCLLAWSLQWGGPASQSLGLLTQITGSNKTPRVLFVPLTDAAGYIWNCGDIGCVGFVAMRVSICSR